MLKKKNLYKKKFHSGDLQARQFSVFSNIV